MGSRSDWSTMEHAVETLSRLEIPHDVRILSGGMKTWATFAPALEGKELPS